MRQRRVDRGSNARQIITTIFYKWGFSVTITELSNNIRSLISSNPQFSDTEILYCEPMSRHTTFRIGGPAAAFALPKNISELKNLIDFCKINSVNFIVIGNGSNLLVNDNGVAALVISILKINQIEFSENAGSVTCGCGVLLPKLSSLCAKHGLSGAEFACAIPGTVGGGVFMNCGSYGGQIADIVEETEYLAPNGEIKVLPRSLHEFSYRESFFSKNPENIILSVKMMLNVKDKCLIESAMRENLSKRCSQPAGKPSAGSVFKRTDNISAGKLIEDCGLKGCRAGGACISPMHAGFIVNDGNAAAKDVLSLIKTAQDAVKNKFGINLECEIKII